MIYRLHQCFGVDVLLLAALGWIITATRGAGILARAGGALLTASFGSIMITLKAPIHH